MCMQAHCGGVEEGCGLFIMKTSREFPGHPVVGTPRFHFRGAQVLSLDRELRSQKLCSVA